MFWQTRNTENSLIGRTGSPSPTRRSSIERLQKASRVRNSNILALEQKQEYDPTRLPHIERPLSKVQGNSFLSGSASSQRLSEGEDLVYSDFSRSGSDYDPPMSPTATLPTARAAEAPRTPSKDQVSPTKSSMSPSKFRSSFDDETIGTSPKLWMSYTSNSEHELPSGRSLHRHAKSVTFDAAPPQINEYEMATPDLSSVGTNSREGSYESLGDEEEDSMLYDPASIHNHDDSFDASLEDTDKTPVVGPDDWRGDSPVVHARQPGQWDSRSPLRRSDSVNSNGEHRPLPPLPGAGHSRTQSNGSNPASPASPALSATAERMLGSHRSLPSPPPASASKSDIQNIGNGKMTLEERLKLMMLSDDNTNKSAAEQQRERRLRRANGRERLSSPVSEAETTTSALEAEEEGDTIGDISALGDFEMPTRISRESIMRRVNGNKTLDRESDYHFSSPAPSSSPQRSPTRSPERRLPMDPDVPIPSTEDSMMDNMDDEEGGSVIITRNPEDEYDDDDYDLYDQSQIEDDVEIPQPHNDDDSSHYSEQNEQEAKAETEQAATPTSATSAQITTMGDTFPDLGPNTRASTFSRDFESYMLPKPEDSLEQPDEVAAKTQKSSTPTQAMSKPEYDGSGWGEPDDELDDEPGTPDSVIHHPMAGEDLDEEVFEDEPKESPAIPERIATVKASGSKLKTRVSNTPSDLAAMREARRQVSLEVPDVPPIPQKHRNRQSREGLPEQVEPAGDEFLERHPSFKNRSLTLDLDLGLSLDQDFDRVIEGQKVSSLTLSPPSTHPDANSLALPQRGYLMRQNTKLVSATDEAGDEPRMARSAGNSPVKGRPQSCVVEPWNGKPRKSTSRRKSAIGAPPASGPVPPMPGQQSNATSIKSTQEEEDERVEPALPETGERGRLFVKVMGVKDLDLPLPKSRISPELTAKATKLTNLDERSWFSLTLDNGVHCVTTAWLELARNAPIGQEFELVVPNDLEFQLTLNVKLDKPTPIQLNAANAKKNKPKTSAFSRVFASPKKRKELEIRQREEDAQQRDAQARQRNAAPTAYELLSPLAAEDGSFGRSYVCLKEHESRCFGRPYMAEIACFNEWATEEADFASSVKSKRGTTAVVRRAPYQVGKLEVQLLFVPRPKNTTDDDMPKSMNSCIRELKASEERLSRNWEGHLSQQGGDCPVS